MQLCSDDFWPHPSILILALIGLVFTLGSAVLWGCGSIKVVPVTKTNLDESLDIDKILSEGSKED